MSESKLAKIELEKVLRADVAEILAARTKSKIIHNTKDIDAAGDEVEKAVRKILQLRLPSIYYVGHGHIVDMEWSTSPQLDVVISNNNTTPILFRTENQTEYFPCEAVYALGEIKSTYYKQKKYIEEFTNHIIQMREELIGYSGSPGMISSPISFMFFVDSNDFHLDQIRELYNSQPASNLPDILCFLDKGILYNTKSFINTDDDTLLYDINISNDFERVNYPTKWIFRTFGAKTNRQSANFGFFSFSLLNALIGCQRGGTSLAHYFLHFVTTENIAVL